VSIAIVCLAALTIGAAILAARHADRLARGRPMGDVSIVETPYGAEPLADRAIAKGLGRAGSVASEVLSTALAATFGDLGDGAALVEKGPLLAWAGAKTALDADLADGTGLSGASEFVFLPVRHAVWSIRTSTGRLCRFEIRDSDSDLIRRSRVMAIDDAVFPRSEVRFLLSDRNLTDDLWVCNRRTGLVELWESRLDGNLVAQRSTHELGEGDYTFLPSRYTVWVIDQGRGTLETLHFRHDQDRSVVRSRRVTYNVKDFPEGDVVHRLSERNYSEVLWLCNERSGDVEIWQPAATGNDIRLRGTFASRF
jgi:hypothetical protein